MDNYKTIQDILIKPAFLCMSCDNETDNKYCNDCLTKQAECHNHKE